MAKVITWAGTVNDHLLCDGGTAEDPITLADIRAADVAGGWGIVTEEDQAHYTVDSSAFSEWRIGSVSTTFVASVGETVFVRNHGRSSDYISFRTYPGCTFRLGVEDGTSSECATWVWGTDATWKTRIKVNGPFTFYNSRWLPSGSASRLVFDSPGSGATFLFDESTVSFREMHRANFVGKVTWQDSIFSAGLSGPSVGHSITNSRAISTSWGLGVSDSGTVRGLTIDRASSNDWYPYGSGKTVNCIDCSGIDFTSRGGTNGVTFNEQFSVNLTSEAGATLSILDAADNEVASATADGSGVFAEQIITHATYVWASGGGGLTQTEHGPFTVAISKTGYQTWSDTWAIDAPIVAEIGLLDYSDVPAGAAVEVTVQDTVQVEVLETVEVTAD